MSKTVNRTPGHLSQVGADERVDNFNLVSFEGITNSENDLTVSPSTFIDANNMYINSNDILSSRPTIKSTKYLDQDFIDLEGVKNTWVVDDLLIYHKGTKLKFIKNNVPSDVEIEVGDVVNVLESVENYVLVYPANIYIDVTSKDVEGVFLYSTGPISDICYIPTTELRSGNQITYPEKPNKLSPLSKHSVVYDKSVYTDLSEFYGKDVDILIGDKTYHINDYKENNVNTIQGLSTIADFDYVKYSTKGSAIGYKNAIIYYAPDGKNFTPLPTVPGNVIQRSVTDPITGVTTTTYPKFTGEAFISEEGDACFVVSLDHLYAISLVDTAWDSASNTFKKRWDNWTMLNWSSQYSKLTYSDNKLVETTSDMIEESSARLNLVNMTKPDEPRPWYYSKNYSRVINENTFAIFMYAGDLEEALVDGQPKNYIKPTIFVYNRQVDGSAVKIYQIQDRDERFYPLPSNPQVGFNGVAEINGGDIDLFGNIMMISLAYRYASSHTISGTNESNAIGTAVTNAYIASFVISVDTSGNYTYRSGQRLKVSDELIGMNINLIQFKPIIGDMKINYSSYNPGMNSGQYTVLVADINYAYTNPAYTQGEQICVSKYSMKEVYYIGSGTNTTTLTSRGSINFVGLSTTILMMSRSALRIATTQGLLVTTSSLDKYEFIPYLVSEVMNPLYIDEDSLLTQGSQVLKLNVKNNSTNDGVVLDLSDEQQNILDNSLSIRQTNSQIILVTLSNKDSLGIVPGRTSMSTSQDFSDIVVSLPDTTAGYVGKYIMTVTLVAYENKIYTTDNIVSTFSILVTDNNFVLPNIKVSAKLSEIYFGADRNLLIGKFIYDEDEKLRLYFSEGLWEEFEETIFQLQILSKNSIGVYCRDSIWVVYSDDKGVYYKSKSKITNSCREGDMITLSIDGKGSLYPCHRGIAYIEHQSLLSIEEQQLDFISDAIQTYIVDWIKDKSIRMFNYEFWLYIYSREDNIMWIMDLRNNHWWKWTTPYPIDNMFVYLNELYILSNNNICKFVEDEEYYDILDYTEDNRWNKRVISWSFESQRLYIKDINRYKHIYNMIINTRIPDESTKEVSLRLSCFVYRTSISRIPDEVLEYKVSGIRSYVKRLRIFKCNFFKFKLSSDTENNIEGNNYNQRQMKIEGITLKYGIRERIR